MKYNDAVAEKDRLHAYLERKKRDIAYVKDNFERKNCLHPTGGC